VCLGIECIAFNLHKLFLVKFNELFLVVQHFLEEFFASRPASMFLAIAHLLFEAVQSLGFLLALREHFSAFIKLSVAQLSLEEVIAMRLCEQLGVC
jgi:hypothetical protein